MKGRYVMKTATLVRMYNDIVFRLKFEPKLITFIPKIPHCLPSPTVGRWDKLVYSDSRIDVALDRLAENINLYAQLEKLRCQSPDVPLHSAYRPEPPNNMQNPITHLNLEGCNVFY